MTIEYITTTDKNGKARYYRVTDGKKKVISRSEYEANAEINVIKTENFTEEVRTPDYQITLAEDFEEIEREGKETSIEETYEKSDIGILNVARKVLAESKVADWKTLTHKTKGDVTQIKYRRCIVCTFTTNGDGVSIGLLGTTAKGRKKMSYINYKWGSWNELLTSDINSDIFSSIKDGIISQIRFIDTLWDNLEIVINNAS